MDFKSTLESEMFAEVLFTHDLREKGVLHFLVTLSIETFELIIASTHGTYFLLEVGIDAYFTEPMITPRNQISVFTVSIG